MHELTLSNLGSGALEERFDDELSRLLENVFDENTPALVGNIAVPNPVALCPFRTFPEIEQPSSMFVLRMRSGEELPEVALFDLDDTRWQLDAIQGIRTLIAEGLEGLPASVAVIA